MRAGRLFRFIVIPRFRRLYRCPECSAATDVLRDHALTHMAGYRPGNPGRPENTNYREIVIEDEDRIVPRPRRLAPPDDASHWSAEVDHTLARLDHAEEIAAGLAHALAELVPTNEGQVDALEAYYTWKPNARPGVPA